MDQLLCWFVVERIGNLNCQNYSGRAAGRAKVVVDELCVKAGFQAIEAKAARLHSALVQE